MAGDVNLNYESRMNQIRFDMEQFQEMELTSDTINNILDGSEFGENLREFRKKMTPLIEVLRTIEYKAAFPFQIEYTRIVGSYAEETYLSGSDLDFLVVLNHDLSVDNNPNKVSFNSKKPDICLSRGPFTPAGYTKLQIYLNGKPCVAEDEINLLPYSLYIDNNRKSFLDHKTSSLQNNINDICIHGPAFTTTLFRRFDADGVYALKSKTIPNDMEPWFERERPNNWPSENTRDLFRNMGCFYVGVGHSNSVEQNLEWRISPTEQELHLMLNLNQTQYRCYILLKSIKKRAIEKFCGNCISSYHCKTALFYTIENIGNNASDFWQPKNLILCTILCLKLLSKWVVEKKCPNFFIPEENMFETKLVDNDQLEKLKNVLSYLIQTNVSNVHSYLLSGNGAGLLRESSALINIALIESSRCTYSYGRFENQFTLAEQRSNIGHYIQLIKTNKSSAYHFFEKMVSPFKIDINVLLEILEQKILHLDKILSLKYLNDKTLYFQRDLNTHISDMSVKTPGDLEYCLKLATIAAAHGDFARCDKLLQLVKTISNRVNVVCVCNSLTLKDKINTRSSRSELKYSEEFREKGIRVIKSFAKSMNQQQVQNLFQHLQSSECLQFNYTETCVSMQMHFELHKEVGLNLDAYGVDRVFKSNLFSDYFFNISIHPSAYMYFLQYKNSETMNKKSDACVALEKLEHMNWVSLQHNKYPHPDTILNILGHIYITNSWYRLALQCFRRSWQINANYNAAKWHVMFMLFYNPQEKITSVELYHPPAFTHSLHNSSVEYMSLPNDLENFLNELEYLT